MTSPNDFKTLEEIELRKAQLLNDIQKDETKMNKLWHSLFKKPDALDKAARPSRRINSLFNAGAGAVDAFLLGWKLYRKFKK
jgi:hypothetical protein